MQPRYFIGITLPDRLSQTITHIQRELFVPGTVMEPLVPHITLLHPNLLETLPPSYFVPKLKQVADAKLPWTIELKTTALFDRRVLHISVHSPELLELQIELASQLPSIVKAQYEIGRQFTAHVTLAQAKPRQELPLELIDTIKAQLDPLLPHSFTVKHLTQFIWLRPRTYKLEPI